jgi:hypothetical protein
MCVCGAAVSAHSHQLDDEPAPRSPAYYSEQFPASSILPGAAALPIGQQLTDCPVHRPRDIFDTNVPNVTLALHAAARRLPVIYSPSSNALSTEPESGREPAPESPAQMSVGRFAPAAHFLGPINGLGVSTTAAWAALTMTDQNGKDVTAACAAP